MLPAARPCCGGIALPGRILRRRVSRRLRRQRLTLSTLTDLSCGARETWSRWSHKSSIGSRDRAWSVRADAGEWLWLTAMGERDGELDGGAGAVVVRGPEAPAVCLDDGAGDRQPHAHAVGLGGVERAEQA